MPVLWRGSAGVTAGHSRLTIAGGVRSLTHRPAAAPVPAHQTRPATSFPAHSVASGWAGRFARLSAASVAPPSVPSQGTADDAAQPSSSAPAAAPSRMAGRGRLSRDAAAAAYEAQGAEGLRSKRPPGTVKRSVALHIGYVGTAFSGALTSHCRCA